MKLVKKTICIFLSGILCFSLLCVPGTIAFADSKDDENNGIKTIITDQLDKDAYTNYYESHKNEKRPIASIGIEPEIKNFESDGISAFLFKENNSFSSHFIIEESGSYFLRLNWCDTEDNITDISIKILIDGVSPFSESGNISLDKIYCDELTNGKFETDKYDNDIRPFSKEIYRFQSVSLSDNNSLYDEPYIFSLEKGEHIITIETENIIAISSIEFYNERQNQTYNEYIKKYSGKSTGVSSRQEAELIFEKNSDNIYPTYEKADAATYPISPISVKLNTIGQANWSRQGQSISWKANVKKAGLYSISFRVNQSYNDNGSSYRKLLVNGEMPFKEAECIEFPYAIKWYTKTLGDDKPMFVYIEPDDIITLECTGGKTCEISRNINTTLKKMSDVYRRIFVITGATPDAYTDYNLDVKIPDLMSKLSEIKNDLNNTISQIIKITGKKNSAASTLNKIVVTINKMIDKPYDIHRYVSDLSDDISSMGALVMSVGQQPLELDCIYFTADNEDIPNGKVNVFKSLFYGIERFLFSYSRDYDSFSGKTNKLKVWVSTGRDQLQIIQRMIEDDFENTHDSQIELSLVDTGATLIQATIAGKGPDVALTIESGTPINLAIRGALIDLKNYDLDSIYNEFNESAWTPYKFKESIYAIPETQVFDVIFYRTDIFEILNLKVPSTWDEFYEVLEILQRYNLEVGIPEIGANAGVSSGISTFARFLLQNGGTYYTNDFKKTAFNTNAAYQSFDMWVSLYSKYGLARSFDFFNRFRTGSMAMSFQPYNLYNQIYASAPEIRGSWAMAPMCGTQLEDGSINRAENSSGSGCIMLKSAKEKGLDSEAFEFMKWWTCGKTQLRYAKELEATMGIAARYTPANTYAFENLGWKQNELSVLKLQKEQVVNFREIPGNYVLPRSLTSAFRKALTSTELPERQLELYNKDINDELERKAKEFNLY